MRRFAQLYQTLDSTTSTQRKTQAIVSYLVQTPAADAAWAVYFLGGGKLRRLIPSHELRALAVRLSGLEQWLFEECYQSVGDLAETIALLWPEQSDERDLGLAQWIESHLLVMQGIPARATFSQTVSACPVREQGDDLRQTMLEQALSGWDSATRFVCLKLLTGGLRVGVSRQTVVRALATLSGLETTQMAQRMMGYLGGQLNSDPGQRARQKRPPEVVEPSRKRVHRWPDARRYELLLSTDKSEVSTFEVGQPYPFFLAHPWPVQDTESVQAQLGVHENWIVEWKWDGIRAQIMHRAGDVWIWSRGEELISEQFPEVCEYAHSLPEGTVIDGELLVWLPDQDKPEPFAALQRRLGKRQVSARLMRELPVTVMAYDLLESDATDWRERPLIERKHRLEQVLALCHAGETESATDRTADVAADTTSSQTPKTVQKTVHQPWKTSPLVFLRDWADLVKWQQRARELGVEGLMVKAAQGRYGVGRTKASGPWYKFKCDPMTVDAVLIYAQRGHGRRAGLYTDYTFGVWNAPPGDPQRTLVPVTKAYSGLSDAEIKEVDAIIKKSTQQSFGPVRKVEPVLVFEIGFEGIAASTRHKSGVALRFSRILRWRKDKPVSEADSIFTLRALMP